MGSEILTTDKKYLGTKIDGKLTYLGSEILRAKVCVNELGCLERKVFQNTIVSKKQFKKNGQHSFGGFLKFGQHIWGSEKMA